MMYDSDDIQLLPFEEIGQIFQKSLYWLYKQPMQGEMARPRMAHLERNVQQDVPRLGPRVLSEAKCASIGLKASFPLIVYTAG